MSKRAWIISVLASVVIFAGIVYVAGLAGPYDTEGEGPWPENYR